MADPYACYSEVPLYVLYYIILSNCTYCSTSTVASGLVVDEHSKWCTVASTRV